MLQVQFIKEHKEAVLAGLEKRGVKDFEQAVASVLQLDEDRKATQTKLDATLSESNKLSKEIGMLFKSGETAKANEIKEQTTGLKEQTKKIQAELQLTTKELNELRTQIPNVPHESVPAGSTEEDNEEVFQSSWVFTLSC